MTEYLLSDWAEMAPRIREADQVLLMTDFDGTLSPIANRPDMAVLPDETRKLLETLAMDVRAGVAVISGRALSDVRARTGIPGITYVGNHGLEIEGPCLKFVYPRAETLRPVIRQICADLGRALSGIEGAVVEDKGITLSVHYRLVADDRLGYMRKVFEDTVRAPRAEGKVRTTEGKRVYEVRPGVVWDKEDAIVLLLTCWRTSDAETKSLIFDLGDDLTDEGGFSVVNALGGISVFVGEPEQQTAARYFLRNPWGVREFLDRLCAEMG